MRRALVFSSAAMILLACGATQPARAPAPPHPTREAEPPRRVAETVRFLGPFASVCEGIDATELAGEDLETFGDLTCACDYDPDAEESGEAEPAAEEPYASRTLATELGPDFTRVSRVSSCSREWMERAGGMHLAVETPAGVFVHLISLGGEMGGAGLVSNRVAATREVAPVQRSADGARLILYYMSGVRTDYQRDGPEEDDDGPEVDDLEDYALVCALGPSGLVCARILVGGHLRESHLVHRAQSFERTWTSTLTVTPEDIAILARTGDLPEGVPPREELELDLR